MKTIYVIIASQEYDMANHQGLWKKITKRTEGDVVVVNIPADYVLSVLKNKRFRIADSRKPPREIDGLRVVRPLLTFRPELLPGRCEKMLSSQFWASVRKAVPDVMDCQVNLIVYNAFWVRLLKGTHHNMKVGYFLFDEVRSEGETNKRNKRRYKDDDFACRNCDIIFTMTQTLADSRKSYNKKTIVVGNGATFHNGLMESPNHINKSIAFIGNFRDWIDKHLLEGLISSMSDCIFFFVGFVDANMQGFLDGLLNKYSNTVYKGKVSKDRIGSVYKMFDVVIVPYLQNDFTKVTRPIKIVEAVMSGTPVVTIPMGGYTQSDFIRFATNTETFEEEIRYLFEHPIDKSSVQYQAFCNNNSWDCKAKLIIESFDSIQ